MRPGGLPKAPLLQCWASSSPRLQGAGLLATVRLRLCSLEVSFDTTPYPWKPDLLPESSQPTIQDQLLVCCCLYYIQPLPVTTPDVWPAGLASHFKDGEKHLRPTQWMSLQSTGCPQEGVLSFWGYCTGYDMAFRSSPGCGAQLCHFTLLSDLGQKVTSWSLGFASLKRFNKNALELLWGLNKHSTSGNLKTENIYPIFLAPLKCLSWWAEEKKLIKEGLEGKGSQKGGNIPRAPGSVISRLQSSRALF